MITFTRLYILRHGQVSNHHEKRYNGHHDVDITDLGMSQMKRAGEYLKENHPSDHPITKVFTSDLIRAQKGGNIIADILGVKTEAKKELRELSFGRWDGLTKEEGSNKYPEESSIAFKDLSTRGFKEGESLIDLQARAMPCIESILSNHCGESICMVLHGGINRVILCDVLGLSIDNFFKMEQDYGCLNIIDIYNGTNSDGHRVAKLINGGPNQLMEKTQLY